jgi:hypothetical protein
VLRRRPVRVLVASSGVVLVTYVAYRVPRLSCETVPLTHITPAPDGSKSQPKIPAQDRRTSHEL